MSVMMECGCAANAKDANGNPVCFPHVGIHPGATVVAANPPDLTGRMARCAYNCGHERPSVNAVAFFEYCGEGSNDAALCASCGCHESVHTQPVDAEGYRLNAHGQRLGKQTCVDYRARGDRGFDRFYCGCRGWD